MSSLAEAALRCCRATSHYYGYYHPGSHVSAGKTLLLIIVLILGYAVLHAVAGALLHPFRGHHRENFGWSLRRGPWASVRLGRRTTVYHDF